MAESFVWLVTSDDHPDWSLRVVAYSEAQALKKARRKPPHVMPPRPWGDFAAVPVPDAPQRSVRAGDAKTLPALAKFGVNGPVAGPRPPER